MSLAEAMQSREFVVRVEGREKLDLANNFFLGGFIEKFNAL